MLQQVLAIASSLCFVVPLCDKATIIYSACSAIVQVVYKVEALF